MIRVELPMLLHVTVHVLSGAAAKRYATLWVFAARAAASGSVSWSVDPGSFPRVKPVSSMAAWTASTATPCGEEARTELEHSTRSMYAGMMLPTGTSYASVSMASGSLGSAAGDGAMAALLLLLWSAWLGTGAEA